MHYYSFNIADYRKDTHHLDPTEHYIYRFLMDSYYLNEKPIPKETHSVLRRLRLDTKDSDLLNNVLNDFFVMGDGGWHHKRIDAEISDYHSKCSTNKENGKKGGRPKKQQLTSDGKPKKTQSVKSANPFESESNPNQEPLTNNQEPRTKQKTGSPTAKFNFKSALINLGIDEQVAIDWLKVRSKKRATNSETAFNGIAREISKSDFSANEAAVMAVEKSWSGFQADWLKSEKQKPAENLKNKTDSELMQMAESLSIHSAGKNRWDLISAIEAKS